MTARFTLTVPQALGEEAKETIEQAPATEVISVEPVGGPSPGQERTLISVIAHDDLAVVDALYDWLGGQPDAAEARLAPLGGQGARLADIDAAQMKGRLAGTEQGMAIGAGAAGAGGEMARGESGVATTEPTAGVGATGASLQPYGLTVATEGPVVKSERSIAIERVEHIAIRVANIRRAEEFYSSFFQMDVMLRARREGENWTRLPADYDWDAGLREGVICELVYLQTGNLALVLLEAGRGAIFVEPRLGHISLRVSAEALTTLRAQALVRSAPVTTDQPHSFVFQDPFGVTWHLGDVPEL